VTALELLVALDHVTEDTFPEFRQRIDLAFNLSNGRIVQEPRVLICKDLLRIPFPSDLEELSVKLLSNYMDVIRRADSLKQMLDGRVPWKGGFARIESTLPPKLVVDDVKKQWIRHVEDIADGIYPDWRDHLKRKGRRLPAEIRTQLGARFAFELQAKRFVETFLEWLGARVTAELLEDMRTRLDAVLRFTGFVVGEFLEGDYSLEKRSSDIFDQFQLHYLAIDRFMIVSEDSDLTKRSAKSPQAKRIMSFDTFLQGL